MLIHEVPLVECERIASELGLEFDGREIAKTVIRTRGRLRANSASNPYPKLSASYFRLKNGKRRKVGGSVCWHGHRDFMRYLFEDYPGATVITGLYGEIRYEGYDDFARNYRDTGLINIGPEIAPVAIAVCCDCPEQGLVQ